MMEAVRFSEPLVTSTRLHGLTHKNIVFFTATAVRSSDLTEYSIMYVY
jgi:hypothetical protein